MIFNMAAVGWPFVAIFVVGLLLGFMRTSHHVKGITVVALALCYAAWVEYSTHALATAPHLLSGQVVAYIGSIVVFLMLGIIGTAFVDRKMLT